MQNPAETVPPDAERAGTRARPEDLVDLEELRTAYFAQYPDPTDPG